MYHNQAFYCLPLGASSSRHAKMKNQICRLFFKNEAEILKRLQKCLSAEPGRMLLSSILLWICIWRETTTGVLSVGLFLSCVFNAYKAMQTLAAYYNCSSRRRVLSEKECWCKDFRSYCKGVRGLGVYGISTECTSIARLIWKCCKATRPQCSSDNFFILFVSSEFQ